MARRRYKKKVTTADYYLFVFGAIVYIIYFKVYKQIPSGMLWAIGLVTTGILIAIPIIKKRKRDAILSKYAQIDKMTGIEFENFVKAVYEKRGYRVTTTPQTNDYGCDLVLQRDGVRSVVQVKRYKTTVGIAAIQQIIGAIRHYDANDAKVVTNNYYTSQAKNLASSNGVELIDRDGVVRMLNELNVISETEKLPAAAVDIRKTCPRCNGNLVLRTRTNGDGTSFYGCSNFPNCRYTVSL